MKRIQFGLALLLSLLSVSGIAQNAEEDFQKINDAYANSKQLSMDVVYNVYANAVMQTPIHSEKGKIMRKGDKSYQKIGVVETIATPRYQMIADHSHQTIVLTHGLEGTFQATPIPHLSALLKLCEKINFEKINDQTARYTLVMPSDEYSKMIIEYDLTGFWMQKMILFYRNPQSVAQGNTASKEPPKLEMIFQNINPLASFNDSQFSYGAYLLRKDDQYQLKKEYEKYQFINHLN